MNVVLPVHTAAMSCSVSVVRLSPVFLLELSPVFLLDRDQSAAAASSPAPDPTMSVLSALPSSKIFFLLCALEVDLMENKPGIWQV